MQQIEDRHPYETCPICGGTLVSEEDKGIFGIRTLDANTVYQCLQNEEHRFWKNAREYNSILHHNKQATETNFDSEQDYVLAWVKQENK